MELMATVNVYAQLKQPYRFEQEMDFSESGFVVISLKKEGLALIRDTDKYAQSKKKWQLEIVDTTLTRVWSTELELENRMILVGYEYNLNHLYLLFREGESNHFGFKLMTVLYQEKQILTNNIKFDLEFKITHFTIAGGSAVFGGYVNNEPAVLLYNQNSEQPKVLPGLFVSDVKLLDIRTNQNQSFNVLLSEQKGRENKKIIVRTYDQDGNLLIDAIIDFNPNYSILTGLTSTLERDELVIAGTYGEGNFKQALGYYSVVVDPFNPQEISYTDFSRLHHFLDYLPQRKADKIRAKTKEEKTVGNLNDFKASVMPYRIEENKNGFYLFSEMYIPSHGGGPYPYSNSFYNPYMYGGNYPYGGTSPYMNRYYNTPYSGFNNQVNSSDYKMTQCLVLKLNPQAHVDEDFSMKFEDVRQNQLEQLGDFAVGDDSLMMVYKNENLIYYSKSTGANEEKTFIRQIKISLKNEMEQVKSDTRNEGVTRHWYDHHFFVWGYQTVSGKEEKRHVFYVNRISLE